MGYFCPAGLQPHMRAPQGWPGTDAVNAQPGTQLLGLACGMTLFGPMHIRSATLCMQGCLLGCGRAFCNPCLSAKMAWGCCLTGGLSHLWQAGRQQSSFSLLSGGHSV